MKLSIVIPTISGREELLAGTKAAYTETRADGWEFEFVVVKNAGNCGRGWNRGADSATGDYFHFTADDILPHEGWLEVAVECADRDDYPAPRIVLEDGTLQGCGGTHGAYMNQELDDDTPVQNSQLPFFRAELWATLGPGLPIHYYADNYFSERARRAGLRVTLRRDYCFTHVDGNYHNPALVAQAPLHAQMFQEALAA